jgi:hypothetical protein
MDLILYSLGSTLQSLGKDRHLQKNDTSVRRWNLYTSRTYTPIEFFHADADIGRETGSFSVVNYTYTELWFYSNIPYKQMCKGVYK